MAIGQIGACLAVSDNSKCNIQEVYGSDFGATKDKHCPIPN